MQRTHGGDLGVSTYVKLRTALTSISPYLSGEENLTATERLKATPFLELEGAPAGGRLRLRMRIYFVASLRQRSLGWSFSLYLPSAETVSKLGDT